MNGGKGTACIVMSPPPPRCVHSKQGLRAYLRAAMRYTYSRVAVPYVVHELRDVPHLHGDYSPEPEEFYLNLGQDSR